MSLKKQKDKTWNKTYYERNKDKILAKSKVYYQKNKEILKERSKQWYQNNKEKIIEYQKSRHKEYYKKNKEKIREYNLKRRRRLRMELLELVGNGEVKCKCGFDDWRAIQVDHVNGGGSKEIKDNKGFKGIIQYMEHIFKNKNNYQLLCANCNWIKKYENDENPQNKIT